MNYRIILFTLLAIVAFLPAVSAGVTFLAHTDDKVDTGDCQGPGTATPWPSASGSCVRGYGTIGGTSCPTSCSSAVGWGGDVQYNTAATAFTSVSFLVGAEGTASITDACLLKTALGASEALDTGAATKCILRARMTDAGGATPCNIRLLSAAGATIAGTLTNYAETVPGSAGCDTLVTAAEFDWVADTFNLYYDGVLKTSVGFAVTADTSVGAAFKVRSQGSGSANPQRGFSVIDEFSLDGGLVDITFAPEKVPGIRATVTQAYDGNDCEIDLFWKLSGNDPNPTTGGFLYEVFLEGISIGDDTITAADSDGIRYTQVVYSGTAAAGSATLYVLPKDPDFENEGPHSDAVTVDCSVLNDSDEKGTLSGQGFAGGSPATNTGNPIGSLVNYFNTSWGFDGTWLFGIMTVIIVMAGFVAFGRTPVMLGIGAFLGVGTSVTLGFFPVWVLFVLIFLLLAFVGTMLGRRRAGDSD